MRQSGGRGGEGIAQSSVHVWLGILLNVIPRLTHPLMSAAFYLMRERNAPHLFMHP